MRKSRKPKITTTCVANHYAASNQRIIEFSDGQGKGNGGLISIMQDDDGRLRVTLSRLEGVYGVEAAAHDLLDACKGLLAQIGKIRKHEPLFTNAIGAAEAAIAKAQGK